MCQSQLILGAAINRSGAERIGYWASRAGLATSHGLSWVLHNYRDPTRPALPVSFKASLREVHSAPVHREMGNSKMRLEDRAGLSSYRALNSSTGFEIRPENTPLHGDRPAPVQRTGSQPKEISGVEA